MTMAITQLEKVLLLRKLKSRVTRVWRFQIYNQIIQIDLVSKHSILGLFAEISVYQYVSLPLVS